MRILDLLLVLMTVCAPIACGGRKHADSADSATTPDGSTSESHLDRFVGDEPIESSAELPNDTGLSDAGLETASDGNASDRTEANSDGAPSEGPIEPMLALTVASARVAGGNGSVTVAPEGTSCGSGCFLYRPGESVMLKAVPTSPSLFSGWSTDCQGQVTTSCTLVMSSKRMAVAHFRPNMNLMFVTSGRIAPGSIGANLAGGDAFCAKSARDAYLGGTNWRAWLSTSPATTNINAATHIGATTSGWLRIDGKPFAASMAALLAGAIFYPPRITELGTDKSETYFVISATKHDGTAHDNSSPGTNCADWTSAVGSPLGGDLRSTTVNWTNGTSVTNACGSSQSIYCFENDPEMVPIPLPSVPSNGRRAFLSSTLWAPGGGVESADAVCQSDAAAAQLPNSLDYRALLATMVPATDSSRINLGGAPWFRLDGAQIVESATDLASSGAAKVLTTINVTSRKTYSDYFAVWTGSGNSPGTGTARENCGNWQSADALSMGWIGHVLTTGTYNTQQLFWANGKNTCDLAAPIYCFQK